jgi:hypothetical protein
VAGDPVSQDRPREGVAEDKPGAAPERATERRSGRVEHKARVLVAEIGFLPFLRIEVRDSGIGIFARQINAERANRIASGYDDPGAGTGAQKQELSLFDEVGSAGDLVTFFAAQHDVHARRTARRKIVGSAKL